MVIIIIIIIIIIIFTYFLHVRIGKRPVCHRYPVLISLAS